MIEAVARAEAAVARMEEEHRELQKSASKSDRVVRDLLAEADEQAATVSVPPGSDTPSSLPDAPHAATTVPSANDSVTLETMMNGELHFSPRKIARVGEFLGATELRANLVSQKIIDLGEKGAAEEAAAEAEQQQQSQLQQPTAKLQQPPPKEDFSHVTEEYLQSLLMQSPTQAQDLIERMAASSVGLISSPKAPTGAFPYNP